MPDIAKLEKALASKPSPSGEVTVPAPNLQAYGPASALHLRGDAMTGATMDDASILKKKKAVLESRLAFASTRKRPTEGWAFLAAEGLSKPSISRLCARRCGAKGQSLARST